MNRAGAPSVPIRLRPKGRPASGQLTRTYILAEQKRHQHDFDAKLEVLGTKIAEADRAETEDYRNPRGSRSRQPWGLQDVYQSAAPSLRTYPVRRWEAERLQEIRESEAKLTDAGVLK